MRFSFLCPVLSFAFVAVACGGATAASDAIDGGADATALVDGGATPDGSPAGPVCPGGTGACAASPGGFAPACCNDSMGVCPSGGCPIDEATCGSAATCLPMASNAGKPTLDFRIRRLTLELPSAFASNFIQSVLFDQGITLNARQCGEQGDGGINWLLRVDRSRSTVTIGGSLPSADPFGTGYCFLAQGATKSQTTPVTFAGSTFASTPIDLTLPIFVSADPSSSIALPIRAAALRDVTISSDSNCIGAFNRTALDSQCADSRDDCARWLTAGAMAGFITLEDADAVPIPQLGNKTLCVMLTGSTPGSDGLHCKRDANNKIAFQGDYCSTTNSVGGCMDSFWFAATFAASAVKICP